VVVTDIPVLREVAGPAALYCPIDDISVWRRAVLQLVREQEDPAARILRSSQAIAHAARYSWSENARRVTDVYEEVLSRARVSAERETR
jgi:glycosyltransferase involved in cell wall biosynthesis